uniref:Uncharacterized protein n=1 Tax=Glossina brevipalpis TaxID=37001 RepID=A0A1A9WWJ2_9MUSC
MWTLAVWKCQLRARARLNQSEQPLIGDNSENGRKLAELALQTFGADASGIEHFDVSETKLVADAESTTDLNEYKDPLLEPTAEIRPSSGISLDSVSVSSKAASFKTESPTESTSLPQGDVLAFIMRRFELTDAIQKQLLETQVATAQAIEKLSDSLSALAKVIGKLDK